MTEPDPIAELIRLKWDEAERSSRKTLRLKRKEIRAEHAQRGTSASTGRWLEEAQGEITAVTSTAHQCLADVTNDDVVPVDIRDENYWTQLHQALPARAVARLHSAFATILRDAETHGHLSGGLQLGLHQLQAQHQANLQHYLQSRVRALRIQQGLRMKSTSEGSATKQASAPDPRKVFIVHGRILAARREMGLFLRSLGLEPVNFDDLRATLGGTPTVADVVTRGMEIAHGVVVLFTADEFATLRPALRVSTDIEATINRWQARPNVMFEAGMAFNRDRKRVVFTAFGHVGLFTDIDGILILRPTNEPSSQRNTLRATLIGMGCAVDATSSDWMTTGDFESWIPAAETEAETQLSVTASDGDASIRLRGWLSKLPVDRSGSALEFSQIGKAAGVSPDQVRRLLQPAVEASSTRWRVNKLGDTVAILILEPLPPAPRRPDRFGGGY